MFFLTTEPCPASVIGQSKWTGLICIFIMYTGFNQDMINFSRRAMAAENVVIKRSQRHMFVIVLYFLFIY